MCNGACIYTICIYAWTDTYVSLHVYRYISKTDYYVHVDALKADLQNTFKLKQMSQNKANIDLFQ